MTVGPVIRNSETADFFDGTAEGRFLLRYCPEGHASSPYARLCDTCGSAGLIWQAASGRATVVSWAVVPGLPTEAGPGEPTVLVIAQLAEGPWWWSQITGADPESIREGMPLTVQFQRYDDACEAVPVFAIT